MMKHLKDGALTYILILFQVALFAFLCWQYGTKLEISPYYLIKYGGSLTQFVFTGEEWRLVTNIFLHGDIKHLVFNMAILLDVGLILERQISRKHYFLYFLVFGMSGALLSLVARGFDYIYLADTFMVSVGASGTILGFLVLAIILRMNNDPKALMRTYDQNDTNQTEQIRLWLMLLFNLFYGFFVSEVDNYAHFGGVLAGIIVGITYLFLNMKLIPSMLLALIVMIIPSLVAKKLGIDRMRNEFNIIFAELKHHQIYIENELNRKKALEEDSKLIPIPSATIDPELITQIDGMTLDKNQIYFALNDKNALMEFDWASKKYINTVPALAIKMPSSQICQYNFCAELGMTGAVEYNEKQMFVANYIQNSISLVEKTTGNILWSIEVGRFPRYLLLTEDKSRLIVFSALTGIASTIELASRKVIQMEFFHQDKYQQPGSQNIYLIKNNKFYFFDFQISKLMEFDFTSPSMKKKQIHLDFYDIKAIDVDDENYLWMVVYYSQNLNDKYLVKFNLNQDRIENDWKINSEAEIKSLKINNKNQQIYAWESRYNNIYVLSMKSMSSIRRYAVKSGGIYFSQRRDDRKLYFFNEADDRISFQSYPLEKTLPISTENFRDIIE